MKSKLDLNDIDRSCREIDAGTVNSRKMEDKYYVKRSVISAIEIGDI